MTEFEQQVAEALRAIKFSGGTAGLVALPMDDEHIERLAPRVAAAIDAAGTAAWNLGIESVQGSVETDPDARINDAALAALRGKK